MAPTIHTHTPITAHEALQHITTLLPPSHPSSTSTSTRPLPPNLEYILTSTHAYLTSKESPHLPSHTPHPPLKVFSAQDAPMELMKRCVERFGARALWETDYLQILDLKPRTGIELETVIEGLDERFSEEQQEELLLVIRDVLGGIPDPMDALSPVNPYETENGMNGHAGESEVPEPRALEEVEPVESGAQQNGR